MKKEQLSSSLTNSLEDAKQAFLQEEFDPTLGFEIEELENRMALESNCGDCDGCCSTCCTPVGDSDMVIC